MQGVGKASIACVALALLGACAPALDWREVRTEDGALTAWLPCKPQRRVREVELAGSKVSMAMLGCRAADRTWGLTHADVGEPARIEPALAALRQARSDNLGAAPSAVTEVEVAGLRATRLRIAGRGAEGQAVVEHSLIFASGTRVFHLAVIGAEPQAEALDAFFGQLRLAR